MNPADFKTLATLVKVKSGLVLNEDKAYLLESRLAPLARSRGLKNLDSLVKEYRTKKDPKLETEIIEAMTTNESLFFRDAKPFELFKEVVLPNLMQERRASKTIRIWSAACSSGQEPYSLAMLLKEEGIKLAGWRIEIIATDLSTEILEKAASGVFSQFEVQRGLPITLLVKYFSQDGDKWVIDAGIRSMVKFQPFNLLSSMDKLGLFDIVFCRNVLIYFDKETKEAVLNRMSDIMQPHSVLYLGGAETVIGITEKFKPVSGHRGLYELT